LRASSADSGFDAVQAHTEVFLAVHAYRRLLGVKLCCWEHEVVEETGECIVGVKRKYVGDILVWTNNDDAALIPVDAPQVEDVPARGVEYLFVVEQPVASLAGQEQEGMAARSRSWWPCWKMARRSITGIDVCVGRGEAADRRTWRGGEEVAQDMKAG
jgi:hypothetical protein